MQLENYYTDNNGFIQFSREQASQFAKTIANDFNPIHNPDAKRFCVPGDLLFACTISRFGLSQSMQFRFSGMVGSEVELDFTPTDSQEFSLTNREGKTFLDIQRSGLHSLDRSLIDSLVQECVAYSGKSFPRLIDLMTEHQVMVNPQRPLIVYDGMSVEMQSLDISSVQLQEAECSLQINGKRGEACLGFHLLSDGDRVGSGSKTMLLSGIREIDKEGIESLKAIHRTNKEAFLRKESTSVE